MSILNDLKKVLFGAKSVAKSAADKTIEAGKEAGQELVDKSGELFDRATEKVEKIGAVVIDKAEDIGQKIWTETEDFVAKARQYAENVTNPPKEEKVPDPVVPVTDVPPVSAVPEMPADPTPTEQLGAKVADTAAEAGKKAEHVAEEVGSKVLSAAENLGEKAAEVGKKAEGLAEDVGSKVLDAADKLGEKAAVAGEKLKEVSENIGSVVIEKSGELYEKAKSFGENMLNKADELVEKAQRAAEEEAKIENTTTKAQQLNDLLSSKVDEPAAKTEPIDTKEGLLEKHDSFFDRAKRFADGDYHNEGGKTTSLFSKPDDDAQSKNKKGGKAAGFEDLDGDGNELIDDAIVED